MKTLPSILTPPILLAFVVADVFYGQAWAGNLFTFVWALMTVITTLALKIVVVTTAEEREENDVDFEWGSALRRYVGYLFTGASLFLIVADGWWWTTLMVCVASSLGWIVRQIDEKQKEEMALT